MRERLTLEKSLSSPAYLRLSLAAALVLRATSGRFYRDIQLHCINLLLTYPESCQANCAYCGLARARRGGLPERSFIRVDWPTLPTEEIIARMKNYQQQVKRVCLSMVTHQAAYQDTVAVSGKILSELKAPLSVLIAPPLLNEERLKQLKFLGVDTVGIGLDAASERVFQRTRGRGVPSSLSWKHYWQTLELSREVFGSYKVNAHIIVGIGETDQELTEIFYRLKDRQIWCYLFCFYPEEGSAMARRRRPSLRRFHRLQLVKYLIEKKGLTREQIGFSEDGDINHLYIPSPLAEQASAWREPFLTGGCPDREGNLVCSRPFGSYRPGESFRDFPFLPEEQDRRKISQELKLSELFPVNEVEQ